MAKLPVLSGHEVGKALGRGGLALVAQRGSHMRYKGMVRGRLRVVVVPNHPEIAKGTLLSIIRNSGYTRDEFLGLL